MVFHEDQLVEVFSRLPGKNLCRFSVVSKSTNKLLSDDFFIKKHSENMRLMGDSDFLLQHKYFYSCGGYDRLEVHPIKSNGNQNGSLQSKEVELLGKYGRILASFNGLLCCGKVGEHPLFLFNPITRSYMQVPIPDETLIGLQFRFGLILDGTENENTDDYLLLSVVVPKEWNARFHCKIFSPSEKIWKDLTRIDLGGRNIILESSMQLKGVLYFVSDGGQYFARESEFFWAYVVAYDMKTDTTKFLHIPKKARKGSRHSNLAIFKWGSYPGSSDTDTICLVQLWRNKFSVWILCTDTDTNYLYWQSVFHMGIKAMGLKEIDETKVTGYSIVNGRTLIFATEEKVYGYDLSDGTNGRIEELSKHGFDGAHVSFKSFCGTFRPCGPEAHCNKKSKGRPQSKFKQD